MKPYLLIRTNEGRYHQGQVSEDTDDRSNICLQPTFYQQLGVTLQNEVGPYMSHKLSLAIFILNGHQANNKNIILSQGAQGVQNLCFYRAYLILLGFLRSQRSLREISFFVFQVSLTSLTGIRGRNAVFMSPKPLISRKSSTINSYSSIGIIMWDSCGIT